MIVIRPARADDADRLCDAQVEGWRVGYRGLFPDDYLDADEFDSERRERWRGASWLDSADTVMLAAELDGDVVGFGFLGPRRGDEVDPGEGEVYAFYLRPTAWGTGVAVELMEMCECWLRDRRFTRAVLWVLRDNPRGRAFYEKAGWRWTGEQSTFEVGGATTAPHPVAELLYERALVQP